MSYQPRQHPRPMAHYTGAELEKHVEDNEYMATRYLGDDSASRYWREQHKMQAYAAKSEQEFRSKQAKSLN